MKIPALLLPVLMLAPSLLPAQFLGKITYERVEGKDARVEVWISAEKIRFRSTDFKSSRAKSMGLDAQEFFYDTQKKTLTLLMKEEKQALEVDVLTLKQMMDGLSALSGKPAEEPKEVPPATVNKTSIKRKIAGTEAFKMEIRPKDSKEVIDLWCTEKYKYDWKRLFDVLALGGFNTDPANAGWMSQNYVPLRLDFKNGDTLSSWEAREVITSVKVSDFTLPAGYTLKSFQQYMQEMMMKSMMGN
jgi:hypothetical protein